MDKSKDCNIKNKIMDMKCMKIYEILFRYFIIIKTKYWINKNHITKISNMEDNYCNNMKVFLFVEKC